MKNKTKILSLIIVILCGVIIFLITKPQKIDPIVSNAKPITNGYETIGYSFKKDDIDTDTTSIHITQPIVSGLPSKLINDAVNSQLDTVFSNIKNAFVSDTAGVEVFSKDMKHQLTVNGGAPLSSSNKLFYVDTEIYSYFSGSAHPLTQRSVYNFVKETGQLIRLEDILKRDAVSNSSRLNIVSDTSAVATDVDFKAALIGISNLAKPKIRAQLNKIAEGSNGEGSPSGADSFEESGADPKSENYRVFYVYEDKIEWVFGQYQVAPYVFGEVKISIPMSELAPYLAPRAYLK